MKKREAVEIKRLGKKDKAKAALVEAKRKGCFLGAVGGFLAGVVVATGVLATLFELSDGDLIEEVLED